jgi:hypothetical protein
VQPVPVNVVALIVAGLLRTVIGMIWFSPGLFGRTWIVLVGCTERDMKARLPRALIVDVVTNVLMAYVLVHAVTYAGAHGAAQGAAVGFFNWLGFVMVSTLFTVTFEGRPFKLFAINNGFHLVSLIAMGMLVTVWR